MTVRGLEVPETIEDLNADPVELFFDLAFVFAFAQLVGALVHHPGWTHVRAVDVDLRTAVDGLVTGDVKLRVGPDRPNPAEHPGQLDRTVVRVGGATLTQSTRAPWRVELVAAGITGQWSAWWSAWALLGWGSGVAVHGFVVWLSRPASDLMQARRGGDAR